MSSSTNIKLTDVMQEICTFLESPIYAIETGTAFDWRYDNIHYLSTYSIYNECVLPTNGKLISIDIDNARLEKCKLFINYPQIEFVQADSVEYMRTLKPGYNLFYLDSCEDAQHGLEEYKESIRLANEGPFVICIDDYNAEGSVKWRLSSECLIHESHRFKIYNTPTTVIVGYYHKK